MKNVIIYDDFLNENTLSSVSKFLKAQYNNIFQTPNQSLNNQFVEFTKKVDTEKNSAYLYQRFIKANQTTVQNEINNAETIEAIDKIVTDEIKYFYFSLKPIVNKLQNTEFTMEKIFERSRDKRLQKLMSYPEDQFSNAVSQYISDAVTPWIKKDAGLEKQSNQQTQQPVTNEPVTTTERIMYNISRILEADVNTTMTNETDISKYKKSAIKWINTSLFDLLKPKFQLLNQLGATTSNIVDQLSKQIKSTNNDNAKKMILNKVINMNKQELQNLANTLGITPDELGQL
jgi:hypothetical protein